MKTSIVTFVSLVAGSFSASAYSIDFNSFQSTSLVPSSSALGQGAAGDPLVHTSYLYDVPGYGMVEIRPLNGSELEVNQKFTNTPDQPINALEFQHLETVSVSFTGETPLDVDFDFVGVSLNESLSVTGISAVPGSTNYVLEFDTQVQDGEAALRSISWTAVPEPSTAILGSLSLLGLLVRRR